MIFAFTGNGNVTKGARELFELLPHEYITPQELPRVRDEVEKGVRSDRKVYGVCVGLEDMVRLRGKGSNTDSTDSGGSTANADNAEYTANKIDKSHYYANPELYESIFPANIAPYVSVIVNGIYWDYRYPRLLTKNQLLKIRSQGNYNLKVVADISCDVSGSFEFLSHTTPIERPFYTYLPESDVDVEGASKLGVLMLGTYVHRLA